VLSLADTSTIWGVDITGSTWVNLDNRCLLTLAAAAAPRQIFVAQFINTDNRDKLSYENGRKLTSIGIKGSAWVLKGRLNNCNVYVLYHINVHLGSLTIKIDSDLCSAVHHK